METFAYRIGKEICGRAPSHFPPCGTSESRVLLGYCIMAAGVAALIVAAFCISDRPHGGR